MRATERRSRTKHNNYCELSTTEGEGASLPRQGKQARHVCVCNFARGLKLAAPESSRGVRSDRSQWPRGVENRVGRVDQFLFFFTFCCHFTLHSNQPKVRNIYGDRACALYVAFYGIQVVILFIPIMLLVGCPRYGGYLLLNRIRNILIFLLWATIYKAKFSVTYLYCLVENLLVHFCHLSLLIPMPFIRPPAFRLPTFQRSLSSPANVASLTARIKTLSSAFQPTRSLSLLAHAACRQPRLVLAPTRASALLFNQSAVNSWTQPNVRHFASATATTAVDTTERVQKLRELMKDPQYNVTAL